MFLQVREDCFVYHVVRNCSRVFVCSYVVCQCVFVVLCVLCILGHCSVFLFGVV